jgi:hypothetical protein
MLRDVAVGMNTLATFAPLQHRFYKSKGLFEKGRRLVKTEREEAE